ncbi:hypothetical protein GCM10010167_27460 [Paractinoplanes deccanensis]
MPRPGLLGVEQADLEQVVRADEPVRGAEAAGPHDGVAQRHGPVVLDEDQSRRAVSRNLADHVPGPRVVERATGDHARLPLDREPDQGTHPAAELHGLLGGQGAQVLDLDRPGGVLVDGERVDHPHRAGAPQPLQFLDDPAPEVRMAEAEHEQLDGSDRHVPIVGRAIRRRLIPHGRGPRGPGGGSLPA